MNSLLMNMLNPAESGVYFGLVYENSNKDNEVKSVCKRQS